MIGGFFISKEKTDSPDKTKAQDILQSLTYDKGFHFFTDVGCYTGETAINLFAFYEELKVIEMKAIKFHLKREDFQKWINNTLGDKDLGNKLSKVNSELPDEELRKKILSTVQERLVELQTIAHK